MARQAEKHLWMPDETEDARISWIKYYRPHKGLMNGLNGQKRQISDKVKRNLFRAASPPALCKTSKKKEVVSRDNNFVMNPKLVCVWFRLLNPPTAHLYQ